MSTTAESDRAVAKRVCTKEGGQEIDGKKVSRCGMVITGPCSSPAAHMLGGKAYPAIHVYLKPLGP